jgi:hypothetical protein
MGLFDSLSNLNPDQTQGLLAAAAQMLQASGPSRMPVGFGQIAGAGMQGYQGGVDEAQKRRMQQEQAQQAAQLRDLQIQEAQGGLQDSALKRQQTAAIQAAARGAYTSPLDAGNMGGGPTPENAAKIGNFDQDKFLKTVMGIDPLQGLALQQQYAKQAPKVKDWKEVQVNGKTLYAPLFENGTAGAPIPYEAAVKLQFQNVGGKTLALNPFNGQEVSSYTNTQSPESVASNAVTIRGQNLTNQRALDALNVPQFNQEAGGFITRPTAAAPGGTLTPLTGYTKPEKPLTESQGKATLFASRMSKADQIMNDLAEKGTLNPSLIKSGLESVPLIGNSLGTAGNFAASSEQQRLEQAQRDFVNAVLRQESGASISPSEFDSAKKQYFPQRGDSEDEVKQKAASRQAAIQGMAIQAGPGAAKVGVSQELQKPKLPKTKIITLDGGGSASATLGTDGNYYVQRGGKTYRVEE